MCFLLLPSPVCFFFLLFFLVDCLFKLSLEWNCVSSIDGPAPAPRCPFPPFSSSCSYNSESRAYKLFKLSPRRTARVCACVWAQRRGCCCCWSRSRGEGEGEGVAASVGPLGARSTGCHLRSSRHTWKSHGHVKWKCGSPLCSLPCLHPPPSELPLGPALALSSSVCRQRALHVARICT